MEVEEQVSRLCCDKTTPRNVELQKMKNVKSNDCKHKATESGGFCYSEEEFKVMCLDIKILEPHGVIFGVLKSNEGGKAIVDVCYYGKRKTQGICGDQKSAVMCNAEISIFAIFLGPGRGEEHHADLSGSW
ncbi:hypothetical protein C2G38_2043277 [Gigaspora rosea]|uniref:Uncharacterized protein n=1 Tax=Gigaspora rosea TaxID=44941 RepID=A0A397UMK0_9GLOM|nr:hypothetical protein C2G38_2043277 [Gigaspora rosea]